MTSTTDRTRPATVTAAAALMMITALGYLITGFALFGQVGRTRAWVREEFREFGDDEFMPTMAGSSVVVFAVMTIVVALLLLGAAVAVRSGSQAGRIVAWAVMGLVLFCGASAITRGGTPEFGGNMAFWTSRTDGRVTRTTSVGSLPDSYPAAFRIGSGIFAGLAMIALIVAIVLLTRPSAGRWFRPQPQPATGPAGYHPAAPTRRQDMFGGPPPGPFAPAQFVAPPLVSRPTGPPWSRPVDGSAPRPRSEVDADLVILARRYQRGEMTDAEYAAAQARLTGA
ncbi:SHOCT domain-containing protein [Actinoplanes sp. NPDC049668]|uniref:SHOCT domain-containing protein n=1 Tax=unclassified Actinoplanes TaxID=2626549 RepID=UPI0033BE76B2